MSPAVRCINGFIRFLLRVTNQQQISIVEDDLVETEVKTLLEAGQEAGVIKEEGKKMVEQIFAFDDKLAYEIMTPRTEVFMIDINDAQDEYMDEFMELRYSRVPVCGGDSDNIIGILHIKDFLIQAYHSGFDNVDIRSLLRKPYFAPETKNIDSLFYDMQNQKQQIAILIDEYGGFSGIVSLEDIIEEVMGNIDDEFDDTDPDIVKTGENTYIIDGLTDLEELAEQTGCELESETSETLAGFLIDMLGEIPADDDDAGAGRNGEREIRYKNYLFRIDSVKERRIDKVTLMIEDPDKTLSGSEETGTN